MARHALLTGAGGFSGPFVAESLRRRGFFVDELRRADNNGLDLRDRKGLDDFLRQKSYECVVHLAGVSNVQHDEVEEIYTANLLGTRNLLAAIHASGWTPKVVILASSAHVYGTTTRENPIEEVENFNPSSDYAVSKAAMEYVAAMWLKKLPVTITRPFNYTGVGQSTNFVVSKIVEHFRNGAERIKLGNIDAERDISDVRDVAEAYAMLAASPSPGTVFNICSGRSTSIRNVIDACRQITGRDVVVECDQTLMREGEVNRLAGSNEHLLRKYPSLSFRPLQETLTWMLSNRA